MSAINCPVLCDSWPLHNADRHLRVDGYGFCSHCATNCHDGHICPCCAEETINRVWELRGHLRDVFAALAPGVAQAIVSMVLVDMDVALGIDA